MTNQLKTLSPATLEHFIKEKVDDYLDVECSCTVKKRDTPYIDAEANMGETDERNLTFEVKLSYKERG